MELVRVELGALKGHLQESNKNNVPSIFFLKAKNISLPSSTWIEKCAENRSGFWFYGTIRLLSKDMIG